MSSQSSSSGYVEVSGARLYYESRGSGPAIVLVHAGITHSGMWDAQFEPLASEYRVVRYDLRNFGRTEAEDSAFADWEDLAALLQTLSIDSAFVIGASMGATVAVELALERPELVRGLILVAPGIFPGHEPSNELLRGWRRLSQALDSGDVDRALDIELNMWIDRAGHRPTPASETVRQRVRAMNARAYELVSDAPNRRPLRPPALTRLASIAVPTLIVTGSHDMPDIGTIAKRLERGISGAETAIVADAAHLASMEQPERFNALVLDFLHRQWDAVGESIGDDAS